MKDLRTEKQIQKDICDVLGRLGMPFSVTDVGLMRDKDGNFKYKRGTVGWCDVTSILPGGIFFGIEVKRQGKNPTEAQEAMHELLQQHGAEIIVARSASEVFDFIQNFKKNRLF